MAKGATGITVTKDGPKTVVRIGKIGVKTGRIEKTAAGKTTIPITAPAPQDSSRPEEEEPKENPVREAKVREAEEAREAMAVAAATATAGKGRKRNPKRNNLHIHEGEGT